MWYRKEVDVTKEELTIHFILRGCGRCGTGCRVQTGSDLTLDSAHVCRLYIALMFAGGQLGKRLIIYFYNIKSNLFLSPLEDILLPYFVCIKNSALLKYIAIKIMQ